MAMDFGFDPLDNKTIEISKYKVEEIVDTLRQVRNYIREQNINNLPPSSLYKNVVKSQKWLNDNL